jgi:hypothetical protein
LPLHDAPFHFLLSGFLAAAFALQVRLSLLQPQHFGLATVLFAVSGMPIFWVLVEPNQSVRPVSILLPASRRSVLDPLAERKPQVARCCRRHTWLYGGYFCEALVQGASQGGEQLFFAIGKRSLYCSTHSYECQRKSSAASANLDSEGITSLIPPAHRTLRSSISERYVKTIPEVFLTCKG